MGRRRQGRAGFILGLHWDYIWVALGLYWDYIGIILYWGYIGIILGFGRRSSGLWGCQGLGFRARGLGLFGEDFGFIMDSPTRSFKDNKAQLRLLRERLG